MTCDECGGARRPDGGCNLCELFASRQTLAGHQPTCWPMIDSSMAVARTQVAQANERAKRHGINVQYREDGRVVIPDRGNRKKLMRLERMHDNSGGYGD